ncbi:MAG: HlyD family efflux transporter periplasmic adaptor subunit, partial [Phycisphaerae bacterium]
RDQQRAVQDLERFTKIDRRLAEKDSANTLKYRQDMLEYVREELRQLEKMYKADDLTEETEEIVLKRQRDAVGRAEFALETAKVAHEKQTKIVLPRQAEDIAAARKGKDEARKNAETALPLGLQKKRMETAKARRDAAEAAEHLAKLKKDRAAMAVEAPMAGLVYYGQCVRGKWTTAAAVAPKLVRGGAVTPDLVLMTVVDPKALRVRAAAPEKQLHLLGKDLKGKATPAGYPDRKLDVGIESVLTVPVSPGEFDVRLSVAGDPGPVTPGMTCEVVLATYEKKDAIAIPASAVHADPKDPKERFVYLKTPGKPQKRVVKIGRTHDGKTEILEGLAEGEIVLLKAPQ